MVVAVDARRPIPLLSRAKLDGLLLRVPCDRGALEALLARMGRLRLGDEGDAEVHPLHLEFWRLHHGAVLFGGIDQHGWSAPFGMRAERWSRASARALGTYSEVMVSVPGVRIERIESANSNEPVAAVVGMLTDSPIARWADRAFGYGYGKELGRFEAVPPCDWTVHSATGSELLRVARRETTVTEPFPDLGAIDATFQQSLLGRRRNGALVRSRLRRSFEQAGAHVQPVGVSLSCRGVFAGLLPERSEVAPYTGDGLWGALAFANLEAGISYPRVFPSF